MRTRLGEAGLISDDDRVAAVFREQGRSYVAHNSGHRRLLRYKVDGAMLRDGERCDFALGVPKAQKVYLVELKGSNLRKAASQLLASLDSLRDILAPYRLHGRIVLSRISRPDLRASALMRLERQLARNGGTVVRACITLEEDV